MAARKALSRPDWRKPFGFAESYGYGPMAAKPVDRRPAEGSRGCAQLSAANCRAVPDPLFAGGLWIYGSGSFPDGPAAEAVWTFRKIFYPIFSRHRVLCSRDYGQPDDRGSNQPAPDYFFNAVHPLQRQASPICFAGRRLFPRQNLGSSLYVLCWDGRGNFCRPVIEKMGAVSQGILWVRHGASGLSLAEPEKRGKKGMGTDKSVCGKSWHYYLYRLRYFMVFTEV